MKEITDWNAQLAYYEKNEDWDAAWDFMQQCIKQYPEVEPENMIYAWGYEYLTNGKFVDYGHQIYNNQELIRELKDLGALGEDIIDISLAYAEEEYLKRQD